MSECSVLCGDVLSVDPGGLFHAVLCDPPYELGFMGKDWDRSGIAFRPETWARIAESLHPGGFLMAFASSRGWHRLAVAIEDAGMRIHPTIWGWGQAQSFPKSTRIPDDRFNGHRYGGQLLKEAITPIIVAQKPYVGRPVECITATGAGAIWVDGGRVGTETISTHGGGINIEGRTFGNGKGIPSIPMGMNEHNGRWPSNLVLLHSADCLRDGVKIVRGSNGVRGSDYGNTMYGGGKGLQRRITGQSIGYTDEAGNEVVDSWECVPGCPVAELDRQSGQEASRFFYQVQTALDAADPIRYQAKAGRKERDAGLEGMPEKYAPKGNYEGRDMTNPHNHLGGLQGSTHRNHHPTVKPIALARYLATLLLPPAEYSPRRIYVPFAGVGSEMCGAMLAGWDEIVGVEMSAEYAEIGEKRMKYWKGQNEKSTEQLAIF